MQEPYYKEEGGSIFLGDVLDILKQMNAESVDMVITSPPYYGLRNYGVDGQIGLEETFDEFLDKMMLIFAEVKRVLKKEGSCWVNIGDSYSGSGNGSGDTTYEERQHIKREKFDKIYTGQKLGKTTLPDKCLCQIPSRFAIEMTNRGWILRNEIIWYKRNCMPSSVNDRFTVDFEKIYFFTKNKKYYFEQQFEDAITGNGAEQGINKGKRFGGEASGRGVRILKNHDQGRNMRCVWDITTKGYREAHFATYPEELCITPIKAGSPVGGIVLDPFMGAGTTGLVAKKLGRQYVGIELNPKYIEIAEKRIYNETGLL